MKTLGLTPNIKIKTKQMTTTKQKAETKKSVLKFKKTVNSKVLRQRQMRAGEGGRPGSLPEGSIWLCRSGASAKKPGEPIRAYLQVWSS